MAGMGVMEVRTGSLIALAMVIKCLSTLVPLPLNLFLVLPKSFQLRDRNWLL